MLNLVLFGPPGAGKGTQSDKIVAKFNLVHVSTGDLLRAEMNAKTDLGLKAKSLIESGSLVPDEVVIGMIANKISANKSGNGFIFDGFPRTTVQAQALDELMKENGIEVSCMISLEVDTPVLVARLLERGKVSGRADDQSEEIIMNRVTEYNNKTAPVENFYAAQSKLFKIKGVGTIEDIFSDISKVCNQFV